MIERRQPSRLIILFIVFPGLLLFLFGRLSYVQFFHPYDLGARAAAQHNLIVKIPPYRGKVFDRNNAEFALDRQMDSLGVHSKHVKDVEGLAERLHEILGLEKAFLRERLSRDKEFVWIARHIQPSQSRQIQKLDRDDLELRKEWKRFYPNASVGSHAVGFTGLDHHGLEGVEYVFDSYLRGVPGWRLTQKDAKQRELVSKEAGWALPVDGYDIHLTLDLAVQHQVERYLEEACRKHNAQGGSAIVMDASTGDILALANYPTFDPNDLKKADRERIRNRAVTDIFEPGSVFKIITLAAVLEKGALDLDDVLYCEKGRYRTGGRVLHDVGQFETLTLEDIIVKSSNIGTVKAAQELGGTKLHEMIKRFGFGERSDIDLPGESFGLLTHPRNWSATSISSVPIGHEVGVTAIQIACAVSAIANDGFLLRPRLITSIKDAEGRTIREFPTVARRRVISEDTARKTERVMEKVVTDGTGRRAAVKGFKVGGKTGTSQKLESDGSYSHDHFIASFAGFVEADGRKITIMVSIDDPKPKYYGGTVAAPVFSKIAANLLEYLEPSAASEMELATR